MYISPCLVDPSSFFLGGWSSTELPGLGALFYIILDSKSRMFPAKYRRFTRIARTIGSSQELRGGGNLSSWWRWSRM